MRFTQFSGAAMTALLVVVLHIPQVGAEEPADTPVSEAVSTAKPIPAEPIPTAEPVPTAEPIPAEPIPTAEPVSAVDIGPKAEPVPTAKPIPSAEPVSVAEAAPGSEEVSRSGMNFSAGNVPTVGQTLATEPVLNGKLLSDSKPAPTTGMLPNGETVPGGETVPAPGMVLSADGIPASVDPVEADPDKEEKMTLRELAIQSHREQMAIYDLDGDNQISEEEWKAANGEDLARGEKFFLVDEDENGKIDENEAIGFLMERVSLSSTYLDATDDESVDVTRDEIKKHAPSELRVTLFSIPLGGSR